MRSSVKNITVVISSSEHPINRWVEDWALARVGSQTICIVRSPDDAEGGDICFLVSCAEIVPLSMRAKYQKVLVIHASDLPIGRGWSPHIWTIIAGGQEIVVSLIEALAQVDRGPVWKKFKYKIPKYYLYEDVIEVINNAHIELMDFAIMNFDIVKPKKQLEMFNLNIEDEDFWNEGIKAIKNMLNEFKELKDKNDN
jgi:methionyl-tRNA formyltransferase